MKQNRAVATFKDFKYKIYVDRHDGKGFELSAWYDCYDFKKAQKEAAFLRRKGYDVEIR